MQIVCARGPKVGGSREYPLRPGSGPADGAKRGPLALRDSGTKKKEKKVERRRGVKKKIRVESWKSLALKRVRSAGSSGCVRGIGIDPLPSKVRPTPLGTVPGKFRGSRFRNKLGDVDVESRSIQLARSGIAEQKQIKETSEDDGIDGSSSSSNSRGQ